MFDDLDAHFFENVLPAYKAFIESLTADTAGLNSDLRLGKDAAFALFHLREHVPWTKGRSWPPFLAASAEYVLLKDIVDVFKHGRKNDGQIASPTDIHETIVLTEYEDSAGPFQYAEKEVTIQLRDGSRRDMRAVLSAVFNLWVENFKANGLLKQLEIPKPVEQELPSRATATGAALLNLKALKGVRFKESFRRQKFNYATGEIEAIDITGHEYQFSIYEAPTYELDINMTNNETGERIGGVIQLSSEESIRYETLATDEERHRFRAELATKYAGQLLRSRRAHTAHDPS